MEVARQKFIKVIVQIIIIAAIIALAFLLTNRVTEDELLRDLVARFGYIGAFFVAVISGINIFVPIPAVSFLPLFIESGLNFYLTIAAIVIGVTVGDVVGYF